MDASTDVPWLLLIHQIPPTPAYLRVKIGRRLERVGAVPIKNSVYVLPRAAETREDFEWIAREVREAKGDALVAEAALVDGLTDSEVRALFSAARDADYAALAKDARPLQRAAQSRRPLTIAQWRQLEQSAAKLRRRFESVKALDFFMAPKQAVLSDALATLQEDLARRGPTSPETLDSEDPVSYRSRSWITRRGVKVDRIASAWLIRKFVDPEARFRFVNPDTYAHQAGDIRFDMTEAEFTHVGDACSFETLAARFVASDHAVREIGEIVHDVDCKDARFQREEAGGLRRLIDGIVASNVSDEARIARGAALFDDLYASFGAQNTTG